MRKDERPTDRGSRAAHQLVWSHLLAFIGIGGIQTESNAIGILGLALLLAGIAVRWAAIHTLGKYFTGTY